MKLTITIDTDLVKVVPVEPDDEMIDAAVAGVPAEMFRVDAMYAIAAAIAAVPDNLPGVARHSGEPVAFETYKGYLIHAGDPRVSDYSNPTPLFTHPPTQPDTTQGKFDDWYTSISIEGDMRHNMLRAWNASQPDTAALLARNSALEEAAAVCSTHAQQQSMFHQHAEMYCADFLANKIIKLITPEITPSPANSLAIVQATLEAAAKWHDECASSYAHPNVADAVIRRDSARVIRALDKQSILDGMSERFYGGMRAWKQTAQTKDRKLSEEMTARVNERVAARLAELPPAQPDTEALLARIMELEAQEERAAVLIKMKMGRKADCGRCIEREDQLAAQAGQEADWYPVSQQPDDHGPYIIVQPGGDVSYSAYFGHPYGESETAWYANGSGGRVIQPTYWRAFPSPPNAALLKAAQAVQEPVDIDAPANSVAIVQAALEAGAKICGKMNWYLDNQTMKILHDRAAKIRAIGPQTILDGMSK